MGKKKIDKSSLYDEMDSDMNQLIDTTDEIKDLLILWKEEDRAKKLLEVRVDRIKNKIRAFLKERQWDRYDDKSSSISVTLTIQKRQSIDKKQLQLMLSDSQLAQVTRVTTSETMRIITPEARERIKKIIK